MIHRKRTPIPFRFPWLSSLRQKKTRVGDILLSRYSRHTFTASKPGRFWELELVARDEAPPLDPVKACSSRESYLTESITVR
jgi:hypothetical protein